MTEGMLESSYGEVNSLLKNKIITSEKAFEIISSKKNKDVKLMLKDSYKLEKENLQKITYYLLMVFTRKAKDSDYENYFLNIKEQCLLVDLLRNGGILVRKNLKNESILGNVITRGSLKELAEMQIFSVIKLKNYETIYILNPDLYAEALNEA